jgi:plastocyanin
MRRTLTVCAALLAGAAALPAPAETVVVQLRNYGFEPAELTVPVGTTVRWENQEKRQYHSVYFEPLGDAPGDYFFPGEQRERRFDTPGDYPYICEPHHESHGMRGVIHVIAPQ